ncbi:NADP-dependent oxidoreductase [Ancylomarina euxinus]|uniref:NADP-dependent oxidoreductase n=1 Tax=Ancylomarina euxinus TaxID=2283627 RepID=A0A425Y2L0_9BACT|nr:NADP-dependent oxidoreductase [Ancylomarina euxinus]MCZ4694994.1 NADP-dependent oxidoreductase [Ancylomarina euxinus]MUP14859.1 zinc-binding dehydrogenase [Ancylomarina euxinus]RRG22202.1 NADP-dependent oxidoreductase [Ancylomarina euxinus]
MKTIQLNKRPVGTPQLSDFKLVNEEQPQIAVGEVLLKAAYLSVDPYLRGRMSEGKSYIEPFELNQAMSSGMVAEVVGSKHEGFSKGEFVTGMLEWKEYQNHNGEDLMKLDPNMAPLSAYLGVLGMTGLTAYLGLTEIGKPKEGETVVVSGAAGAVGSVVGQIAKLLGCRVVGIAGTDEKVEQLKAEYGFDEAINYKTTTDMNQAIAEACPNGVDVYFDNVGGEVSDGVMLNVNRFARIIVCGAISLYNATSMPMGPRIQPILIKNSVLMQGFIVFNFQDKYTEAISHLAKWLKVGELISTETIVEGFEKTPQAFIDLFEGKNKGKMIVKI